jgi:predicted membrane protein
MVSLGFLSTEGSDHARRALQTFSVLIIQIIWVLVFGLTIKNLLRSKTQILYVKTTHLPVRLASTN